MKVEVHACDDGGCGHYRSIWPGWAVDAGGLHDVRVRVPGTDDAPQLPVLWAGDHPVGIRDREEGWPDVMVFQRPLRWAMLVAIQLLQQEKGVAVVVELDDDFASAGPRNAAWSPELRDKVEALYACCSQADLVTTSTRALAEKYADHGRAVVVPNYLPGHHVAAGRARFEETPVPGASVVIGWSGSVNVHRDDLPVVGAGLARARRRSSLETELHVVGTGADVARGLGVARIDHASGWVPIAEYPQALSHFDLGLAPLADTVFNRSKSWLKPLEYAGAGVPCAVSETVEYQRLIEEYPGSVVATCASPDDWRRALTALLADRDELRHWGAVAHAAVATATVEHHREEWANAWSAARAYHQQGH